MFSKLSRWFLGALLLQFAVGLQAAHGQEYVGKVDHIYDGQTVRIFYRGGQIRVRLAALETPDSQEAKQALAGLVAGKTVRVREVRWEEGFLVGYLMVDEKDVGAELVRAGQAHFTTTHSPYAGLQPLQEDPRAGKLGTWAQR